MRVMMQFCLIAYSFWLSIISLLCCSSASIVPVPAFLWICSDYLDIVAVRSGNLPLGSEQLISSSNVGRLRNASYLMPYNSHDIFINQELQQMLTDRYHYIRVFAFSLGSPIPSHIVRHMRLLIIYQLIGRISFIVSMLWRSTHFVN